MDQREMGPDNEEAMRVFFAGMMRNVWTAMPMVATEDSPDGHTGSFQTTVKRVVQNLSTGEITYVDHPVTVDVPVQHPSGGQVASTYPTKQGDEVVGIVASRNIDGWHQNGKTQPPVDNRMHHPADTMHVRGYRSTPNKLQQVASDSVQHRSVDKLHVHEIHPQNGVTSRAADPSTQPASDTFDPFTQASKFFEHTAHPTGGILGRAVDGSTQHDHGVTHDSGAFMRVANALHTVLCHPSDGASMNAANGQHVVSATSGGVSVTSTKSVSLSSAGAMSLSAAAGMLSLSGLANGSIGGASLSSGAASSNVGKLGGDLSGNLPNPQVVNLSNVNLSGLPVADSDFYAGLIGVPVGGLYLNKSYVKTGTYNGSISGSSSGDGTNSGNGSVSGSCSITLPPSNLAVLCVRLS